MDSSATTSEILANTRRFQAAMGSPATILRRIVVGKNVWRKLKEAVGEHGKKGPGESPAIQPAGFVGSRPLDGVDLMLDETAHPDWLEHQFADGHSEIWTPSGWVTKPATKN